MVRHIFTGMILFVLLVLLPLPVAMAIKVTLAMVVLMVYWWVTKPVDYAVTALMPLVLNAFFAISGQKELMAIFFNELVVILISSNIIIQGWIRWNFDKRIAYGFMARLGHSPALQVSAWFTLAVLLSAFVPNLIAAVILMPVAYMTASISSQGNSGLPATAVLAVAFGSSIGGMGTPLGGAMNLVVMENVSRLITHQEVMFVDWSRNMLPLMAALWLLGMVYMVFAGKFERGTQDARVMFQQKYRELGPITREEIIVFLLFAFPAVLSFLRPFYAKAFPDLTPGIIFLAAALLSFFLPARKGPLMEWKEAAAGINWNVVFLMAGGIALGKMLDDSGTFTWLAAQLMQVGYGEWVFVVLVALALVVTNLTTNTAACALITPMVVSVFSIIHVNPVPYVFLATAAANCAFVLPSASAGPAMVVSYGVEIKEMARRGTELALLSYVVIIGVGMLLVKLNYFHL